MWKSIICSNSAKKAKLIFRPFYFLHVKGLLFLQKSSCKRPSLLAEVILSGNIYNK